MHISIFDFVISSDNYTISLLNFNNGHVGTALLGFSALRYVNMQEAKHMWVIHFDILFASFFAYQSKLLYNWIKSWKSSE